MRTTIEITDEQRGQLMRLAAQRGLKGFSTIVQEALDLFLSQQADDGAVRKAALAMEGALGEKEANDLVSRTRAIRETWR